MRHNPVNKMHPLVAIRLMAVDNCLSDSVEFYAEKAYRYYSKTYSTPLAEARKTLTQEEVILIMQEDEMADLQVEELADAKKQLTGNLSEYKIILPTGSTGHKITEDEWLAEVLKKENKKDAKKIIQQKIRQILMKVLIN